MDAKELRIGDWVLNFDKYHQIIDGEEIDDHAEHNCFQPIPLSCEILDKCGFKYQKPGIQGCDAWQGYGYWFLQNNMFFINMRGNFSRTKPIELKLEGHFNSHYCYLHQLQNIYYALTNEELSIQPLK